MRLEKYLLNVLTWKSVVTVLGKFLQVKRETTACGAKESSKEREDQGPCYYHRGEVKASYTGRLQVKGKILSHGNIQD